MKLRNEAAFIVAKPKEPCFLLELEITVSPDVRFNTYATGPSAELALSRWKRGARNIAPLLTRTTTITPDPTGAKVAEGTSERRSQARLPRYLRNGPARRD